MKQFKEIAYVLKRLRQEKELSQYQLAQKISPNPRPFSQMISNVERFICGIPEKHILAFADALDVGAFLLIDAMCMDYNVHLYKLLWEQKTSAKTEQSN